MKDYPNIDLRLNTFGDGTDLVDFEEEGVARFLFNGGLNTLGVGDQEIVTDDLDRDVGGEFGVGVPVVLVEGVFDGDNYGK